MPQAQALSDVARALRRQLSTADYLASRGADGLAALRRLASETEAREGDGAPLVALPDGWQRAIPLKGACMNGHVATLAYLVDAHRCDLDLIDAASGDTAAHVAVAWGRVDAVAWLLARGARSDVEDETGATLAAAAKRRSRLLDRGDAVFAEKLRNRGMDIDALREEGTALTKMLDAVERTGGWAAFSRKFPRRPRVARAAPWLAAAADRAELAMAYSLVSRPGQPAPIVVAKAPPPPKKAATALRRKIAAAEGAAAAAATAAALPGAERHSIAFFCASLQ